MFGEEPLDSVAAERATVTGGEQRVGGAGVLLGDPRAEHGHEREREVLGIWFQETEGAKSWMQVLTDLRNRGVRDILICCVDRLKGFPEAIEAIFPHTTVQLCVAHLIRNSPSTPRDRDVHDEECDARFGIGLKSASPRTISITPTSPSVSVTEAWSCSNAESQPGSIGRRPIRQISTVACLCRVSRSWTRR